MKKTLIVLTLVLATMLQLLPITAFAQTQTGKTEDAESGAAKPVFEKPEIVVDETEPEGQDLGSITEDVVHAETLEAQLRSGVDAKNKLDSDTKDEVITNPLYPENASRARANHLNSRADVEAETLEWMYLDSAMDYFAECLEKRQYYITFETRLSFEPYAEHLDAMFELACEHNGNPTQGDYITWHWSSYSRSGSYSYSGGYYYVTCEFYFEYYTSYSQETALTNRVNQIINGFGFTNSTTDYEKAFAIYEWVTGNITYDYYGLEAEDTMAHTAYKGVMQGTCVCQGYASIIYRMYLQVGIPCRVIAGDSGGPHGWNIAKIDGKWYNLDSTWDSDYGPAYWDWFLKCPNNFPDHYRWEEYDTSDFHADYPMATSDYKNTSSPSGLSGYCGSNVTWTLSQSGVLTISGSGKMYDYDYYNEYYTPWDSDITGISINAIVINNGVTYIGDYAFAYCFDATSISIPSSVTGIGDYAFFYCTSLTGVTIPSKVTTIGECAFAWCVNLTSITVPSSVTSIGTDAFDCCDNLTGIWVNSGNSKYSSDSYGVLFDRYKTTLIKCPGGYSGVYTVPSGVTTIDYSAFYGCWGLTGVSISSSVSTIGKWAFSCCYSLDSIIIPSGVRNIHNYAFADSDVYTIVFKGAAPTFGTEVFNGVIARAYYPTGYSSWNNVVRDYYYASDDNGVIEWVSYNPPFDDSKAIAHPYVEVVTDMIKELEWNELGEYPYWGYGALYDVDGNGVKEMLLVYDSYVDDPRNPGETTVATSFSVYTASGYTAIPLVERVPLNFYAGAPTASVEVWQKNGKSYIAAHEGNYEGIDNAYGTWTLYSVQGTSVTVETTVEYVKVCYSSGSINYNSSYVLINGTRYSYSQYNTWKNGYSSRLKINATMIHEQTDSNVYDQYTLVQLVRDLPIRAGQSVLNGLVVVDGVWGYYINGVLQTDYTGLVPYGDILFYVENGILDFNYTGLVWYQDAWRYVANSQLTEGYTGLVYFNDNWFYTVDSVIDWTFTGLVPYNGNYFYVQNNLLDWSYTGLGYHDGGWYFIQNGLLQKEYSGLVYFNDNWFYVEEGELTYQYFGMVEYQGNLFYVQASHLDWNYTGLGYHEGAWYYFQNALYTPSFTGLVPFEGDLFYVSGGTVDWSYTGYANYNGQYYFVENGVVVNW